MSITEEDAKRAGKTINNISFGDDELVTLIRVTKITLTFLEGRGQRWGLATNPLRQELERLEDFATARGLPKDKIEREETKTIFELRRVLDKIPGKLEIWGDGSGRIMVENSTKLAEFDNLPELMELLGL